MKVAGLREKTFEEMKKMIDEKRVKLATLRMELKIGKIKDTSLVRREKKELAQLLTVLSEKERENV